MATLMGEITITCDTQQEYDGLLAQASASNDVSVVSTDADTKTIVIALNATVTA